MIEIYVDGACRGNPGPAGAGAILMSGNHARSISMGLGKSTNNIAELTAIKIALEAIKEGHREKNIKIYSDSKYAIGQSFQGWNVNKNKDLVFAIRDLVSKFPNIEFEWVKGHSGDKWNEEADRLAVLGIDMTEGDVKDDRFTKDS